MRSGPLLRPHARQVQPRPGQNPRSPIRYQQRRLGQEPTRACDGFTLSELASCKEYRAVPFRKQGHQLLGVLLEDMAQKSCRRILESLRSTAVESAICDFDACIATRDRSGPLQTSEVRSSVVFTLF
jgi:hypothetical protein